MIAVLEARQGVPSVRVDQFVSDCLVSDQASEKKSVDAQWTCVHDPEVSQSSSS